MTKFNQCPNCGKGAKLGFFGTTPTTVYECAKCASVYCSREGECGGKRCPDCGSDKRKEVGKCYK